MFLKSVLLLFLVNLVESSGNKTCRFHHLIEQINGQDPGTIDIGIIKISSENQKLAIDDEVEQLLDCIPDENPLLIPNDPKQFTSRFNSLRLRQPPLIFIVANLSDFVSYLISCASVKYLQKVIPGKLHCWIETSFWRLLLEHQL
jgi:hypothetical protein